MPKVIGPRRESSPTFVPNSKIAIPAAAVAQPKAPSSAIVGPTRPRSPAVVTAPTSLDEAQPRGTKIIPVEFVPPPAPPTNRDDAVPDKPVVVTESPTRLPAQPLPIAVNRSVDSSGTPFAEFERSIEFARSLVAGRENASGLPVQSVSKTLPPPTDERPATSIPSAAAVETLGDPARNLSIRKEFQKESRPAPTPADAISRATQPVKNTVVSSIKPDHDDHSRDLPIIVPARITRASTDPSSSPREPQSSATNAAPRTLSPESVGLAKELSDVSDIPNNSSRAEPPSSNGSPAHRPSDVAKLVDQVFEELRHQRLAEARRRTESLRQLVARRWMTVTANTGQPEATTHTDPEATRSEPRRFHADPDATAAEKPDSKSWMEDN
jgi:hypothetical protein